MVVSYVKRDQVFPSAPKAISDIELAEIVGSALKADFGDNGSAIKQIGRLTNANLRAIKNWYQGRHAPSAGHLLLLARSSPSLLRFVLGQVGGADLFDAVELLGNANKYRQDNTIYSAENCTIDENIVPQLMRMLNQRQHWFLLQLQQRRHVRADDIVKEWGVSIRSAKSDIGGLLKLNKIRYVGAKKTGFYSTV